MHEKPQPTTEDDHTSDDEEFGVDLADPRVKHWFTEHLPELRRSAYGHRVLYQTLALAAVLGLLVHIGGYVLRESSPGEPLALVADLLYALGFALWTGVAVVLFVQVIPEIKQRQIKRSLEAYEAKLDERNRPQGPRDEAGSPGSVREDAGEPEVPEHAGVETVERDEPIAGDRDHRQA